MLRPAHKARWLCIGDDVHLGDGVLFGPDGVVEEGAPLGADAPLGAGVLFGPNVVGEEGTPIGEASVIEMGAVLGKVPRLARDSATKQEPHPPLRLGVRVTVC